MSKQSNITYQGDQVYIVGVAVLDDFVIENRGRKLNVPFQYKIESVDGEWDNYVDPEDLYFEN